MNSLKRIRNYVLRGEQIAKTILVIILLLLPLLTVVFFIF